MHPNDEVAREYTKLLQSAEVSRAMMASDPPTGGMAVLVRARKRRSNRLAATRNAREDVRAVGYTSSTLPKRDDPRVVLQAALAAGLPEPMACNVLAILKV